MLSLAKRFISHGVKTYCDYHNTIFFAAFMLVVILMSYTNDIHILRKDELCLSGLVARKKGDILHS